jgi:hypothetical protein
MLATLLLSGIGGDLNIQISNAAFNMAKPVIVLLVTAVLPMMMTITLVFTIARGYLNSASLQIEWGPLIRMLFIGVLLIFYRSYVPMVGDSVHWLAQTITGTASNAQAYATLQQLKPPTTAPQPTPQQIAQGQVDEPSAIMSLANQIGDKLSAISTFSIQDWIMELATGLIAQLIQVVFLFVQAFLTGFLFVVGPIAITLSVLPGWGGLLKSWFQSFLSVQMWTLAFSIINALFANYSQAQAAVMATQYNSVNDYFAAHASQAQYQVGCIVFIIMYMMVPYMTSLIVGHAATDSFMGAATRMISHAAGPVGKAASVAGGMASEAASSGKSILGGMSSMFGGAGGGGGGGGAADASTAAAGGGGAIPKMMGVGSRITTPNRMLGGGAPAIPSMASVMSSQGGGQSSDAPFISPAYGGSGTGDFAGSGTARGAGGGTRSLGSGDPAAKAVGAARAQSSGGGGSAGSSDVPPLGAASGSWGQPSAGSGGPNVMTNISSRDGILRGIAAEPAGAESGSSASVGSVSPAPSVRQLPSTSASTEANKNKAAAEAALPPLLVPPSLGGSSASW